MKGNETMPPQEQVLSMPTRKMELLSLVNQDCNRVYAALRARLPTTDANEVMALVYSLCENVKLQAVNNLTER